MTMPDGILCAKTHEWILEEDNKATIESVKAASEIYMPVSGKVIEVNEKLTNSPELLNEDAFENWLVKIECDNFQQDSQGLLEYNDYKDEVQ